MVRHVLITLLFIASTARAESWLKIADLDAQGGAILVDTSSIDRGSEPRQAWFKSVFTSDRPIGDGYRDVAAGAKAYRWEESLGLFNCVDRTIAISKSILHGADNGVVGHVDIDPGALKFREVVPASIGGLMVQAGCSTSTADVRPAPSARMVSPANPDDYYPSSSRRRGEEGSPIVKVCVGPSGAPLREPEITGSSGFPDLDAAAVKVAKANRYAAAVEDGAALPESCIKFKVRFVRWNR